LRARSWPRADAYSLNAHGDETTPARARESTAAPKLDPAGIITRVVRVLEPVHAAVSASAAIQPRLTWKRERMLQQDGGGDCIDISLASARGSTHFAHGAKSGGGREPLVHETHGQTGSFLQLGGDPADFGGAWAVVAVLIEREADDEPFRLELACATNHLRYRWALSGSADDKARGRRNCASWVADREADAAVTVVDRQKASRESGIGNRE
jgi:hypothetical protein